MKPVKRFQIAGLRVHPLANLFPKHSDAKLAELVEDIRARGQRKRAVLFQGKILDGRGRACACDELGTELQTEDYTGDDPLGEVLSLNLHRRDLTAADRREVVRQALKIDPSLSNRFVAAKTGVSDKTVAAVREELESTAEIPQLKKTKGRDGKARTSKPKGKANKTPLTPRDRLASFATELEAAVKKVIVPGQLLVRGIAEHVPGLDATQAHEWLCEMASDASEALKLIRAGLESADKKA